MDFTTQTLLEKYQDHLKDLVPYITTGSCIVGIERLHTLSSATNRKIYKYDGKPILLIQEDYYGNINYNQLVMDIEKIKQFF